MAGSAFRVVAWAEIRVAPQVSVPDVQSLPVLLQCLQPVQPPPQTLLQQLPVLPQPAHPPVVLARCLLGLVRLWQLYANFREAISRIYMKPESAKLMKKEYRKFPNGLRNITAVRAANLKK